MKLLLVTNDFPPRVGGIQRYLWSLYRHLPGRGIDVVVLAPRYAGDAAFDAMMPFEVVRYPGPVYWPTPGLRARIRELSRGADAVAFGAVVPADLLAPRIGRPIVVHTHGFEVAWAKLPGLRSALHRIGRAAALVTTVSRYCHHLIEPVVPARTELLVTGVDLERFTPGLDATTFRDRYGLAGRPVISCVSRLVARKGQDTIIEALPAVRAAIPDVRALIVGDGPARARLHALARDRGVADSVVFTGVVAEEQIPIAYAAGDVFAMPCRSRFAGLEVEGLGLVYLEAQACGRPAIAGDSGGAPEAVRPSETGWVVRGGDAGGLAGVLVEALGDPERSRAMGAAGRALVETEHRWEDVADRYALMLGSL